MINGRDAAERVAELARWPKQSTSAPGERGAPVPLVMITAYDYPTARAADEAGVDLILVGDSAATTVLGLATTREVTVEEMLTLTRAARRGVRTGGGALLVGDLPFGSYEGSDALAVATAVRFAGVGCDIVKLEGAGPMLPRVRAVVAAGIPVMGHVGLLPQSASSPAELKAQGRSANQAAAIVDDAQALAAAGCVAIVVEAVPAAVAAEAARRVRIPLIGIGAGGDVDGQVLVYHDAMGISPPPPDGTGKAHVPKFVRRYARLYEASVSAIRSYAADVRGRTFPSAAEEYGMPAAELERFRAAIRSAANS